MFNEEIPADTENLNSRLEFLRFGFVLKPTAAKDYLSETLDQAANIFQGPSVGNGSDNFKQTLCGIIEELTLKQGHKQVGISLSAGLDSRALLGALLEIYEPKDIHALTYGAVSHPDRMGASRLQSRSPHLSRL